MKGFSMPNHGVARPRLADVITAGLLRFAGAPWRRRREQHARLTFAELDVRRLEDRIETLIEVLAELCDCSGQFDVADDFRALSGRPAPDRQLRLVEGQ
jgi:hypothetical protein